MMGDQGIILFISPSTNDLINERAITKTAASKLKGKIELEKWRRETFAIDLRISVRDLELITEIFVFSSVELAEIRRLQTET